jgi:hypothetical protein
MSDEHTKEHETDSEIDGRVEGRKIAQQIIGEYEARPDVIARKAEQEALHKSNMAQIDANMAKIFDISAQRERERPKKEEKRIRQYASILYGHSADLNDEDYEKVLGLVARMREKDK